MEPTTENLPRLLTAGQVAEQTGIPLSRVYELSRNGDIPHVRLGRALRYPAPALRKWIAKGGTAGNGGVEE